MPGGKLEAAFIADFERLIVKEENPLIVLATPHKDETFVHQNNSRPKNPYLTDAEKAVEPDQYAVAGALAALFGAAEPVKEDSSVLAPHEQGFFTKIGKLHEWLKISRLAFEFDHESREFNLIEYREHRSPSKKKATKKMRTLNEHLIGDEDVKMLEVRVCMYVQDGYYMFTDHTGGWVFAESKNFNEFVKLVNGLSGDLKRRSL